MQVRLQEEGLLDIMEADPADFGFRFEDLDFSAGGGYISLRRLSIEPASRACLRACRTGNNKQGFNLLFN